MYISIYICKLFSKINDFTIIKYINNYARTSIATTWESSSICLHEEVVAAIMNWDTTEWKSNHRSLILHIQLRHWGAFAGMPQVDTIIGKLIDQSTYSDNLIDCR